MARSFESFMIPYANFVGPNVTARFIYNYYTSDEYISENSEVINTSNRYEISLFNRLTSAGLFPRQVSIRMSLSPRFEGSSSSSTVTLDLTTTKILYEDSAASISTCGLTMADSAVSTRAYELLRQNVSVGESFSIETPITPGLYRSVSNSSFAAGVNLFNFNLRDVTTDPLDEVSGYPVSLTVSRHFIGDVISSAARDYSNIFADELAALSERAGEIQGLSRSLVRQGTILSSELDYVIDDNYVNHGYTFSRPTHVGYLVEKFRISNAANGEEQTELVSTQFFGTSGSSEIFDRQVSLRYKYIYSVRAVYGVPVSVSVSSVSSDEIEFEAPEQATVFVASDPEIQRVDPIDSVPPEPPDNFSILPQVYPKFGLICNWKMPANSQFDIVGFLVFKRESPSQAFKQIATIDFDQTQGRTTTLSSRYPCQNMIKAVNPQLSFLDTDVSPDKDYIYAICSVDAHNNVSNYSVQLRARYVKATNQTIVTAFSRSRAPITHPNLFMEEDIFLDLIKVKSVNSISIVTNPDFKNLDRDGSLEQILKSNDETNSTRRFYRLNLVDLNSLAQNNFDFNIGAVSTTFTSIDASTKSTQAIRDFIEIT